MQPDRPIGGATATCSFLCACSHNRHRRGPAAALLELSAEDVMVVKIAPNDKNSPPGKLADAELHFTEGLLEGLKLIGFAVWESRAKGGGRNVTFPARQYSVNGERRSFSLLRPANGDATAHDKVRELILQAYAEFEENAAVSS